MWTLKPLLDFNFKSLLHGRTMEEEVQNERESDPLCSRPENWYQGPLIFFEEGEKRSEKEWSD